MKPSTFFYTACAFLMLSSSTAFSSETCVPTNIQCLESQIATTIQTIDDSRWANQSYRDLAVSTAFNGDIDTAISYIGKIDNGDTQAMTIRAIGMALAIHKKLPVDEYRSIFKKLDDTTKIITDEGARDIAYTYIAMAQAFAGLDDDAHKTTEAMVKPALKHKAHGETAEIQAERGDYTQATKSINAIDSVAFKNKALGIVSGIFLKRGELEHAYNTAIQITNPTKKAATLQKIINEQLGLDKPKKSVHSR